MRMLTGLILALQEAATVQIVADDKRCFIFLVHKWPSLFKSFAQLMSNDKVKKIFHGVEGDVSRLTKRSAVPCQLLPSSVAAQPQLLLRLSK